jgi:hypothetical protein
MAIEVRDDTVETTAMPAGSWLIGGKTAADPAPTAFGRQAILAYIQDELSALATTGSADDLASGSVPLQRLHSNLQDFSEIPTNYVGGVLVYTEEGKWDILTPGTAGQVLTSGGDGADVYWGTGGGGGVVAGNFFGTIVVSGQSNVVAEQEADTLTLVGSGAVTITTNAGADTITFDVDLSSYLDTADIGVTVQAYDADILKSNETANLTAGFTTTAEDAGTKTTGTFTPDPTLGNIQRAVNGGAHTLAPPASDCSMAIKYTNNGTAGTITTSGFTMVSGDAPPTTNASVYVAYITVIDGFSHLTWVSGNEAIDLSDYLLDTDIGVIVQAYDADTLKADTADTLTAGFAVTPYNAGTKSSGTFTPDEANGNMQYCVNGGAHTLAPPTNNGTIIVQYTNDGSAGTITTSGFTKVSGDAPGTTSGDDFLAYITKINGFSHLTWVALQ